MPVISRAAELMALLKGGAKLRGEQLFDLAPDIADQFRPEAIKKVLMGKSPITVMDSDKFLDLAGQQNLRDIDKRAGKIPGYIAAGGIRDLPRLEWAASSEPGTGLITGHEGRARSMYLGEQGSPVPSVMRYDSSGYEGTQPVPGGHPNTSFSEATTQWNLDELIDYLKKIGKWVPQDESPPINLPPDQQYFAEGGQPKRIALQPPQLQATIDPDTGRIVYTPVDAGPQALPTPQFQNMGLPEPVRRAAADVPSTPTTFANNRVSGGPSPLEALGAMDIPFRAAGDVAYEGSGSPALGALTQAGLAVASPGSLTKGARFLGKAAAEKLPGALENIAGKLGTQMYAVKPRGGQWIEPDLGELRHQATMRYAPGDVSDKALSGYVNSNLRKWIKTSMGTEETDALAKELGIAYTPPVPDALGAPRYVNPEGFTTANANPFDAAVRSQPAGAFQKNMENPNANLFSESPWIAKMEPKENIHYLGGAGGDLPESIVQMFDYLRTVAPEKLKNIAVPDALRQSKAWHDAIAKKQTEDALKAGSLTTHREYPTGFKWQEIVAPENLPEGYRVENKGAYHSVVREGDNLTVGTGQTPEVAMADAKKTLLAQGLDAEGKMMGHCVGSYCDQVSGGGTRIFSLRDPSGKPHVTVEVIPQTHKQSAAFRALSADEQLPWLQKYNDAYATDPSIGKLTPAQFYAQSIGESSAPEFNVRQIKGKQNAAPVAEYLPYVQDFIKNSPLGSSWGDVRDLGNAGLVMGQTPSERAAMSMKGLPSYVTPEELEAHRAADTAQSQAILFPEGHAAGGAVDLEPDAVEHLRGLIGWGEKFAQGKRHSENVEDVRKGARPESKGPANSPSRAPLPPDEGLDTLVQSARLNLAAGGAVEIEPDAEAYLQSLLEAA